MPSSTMLKQALQHKATLQKVGRFLSNTLGS